MSVGAAHLPVVSLALVVVLAGVVAVVVAVVRSQARRTNEVWGAAASALAGRLRPSTGFGQPRIEAVVDGFHASVYGFTRRTGSSSSVYTRYRVVYRPFGLGLRIHRQGPWQQVAKFFGSQDIEVGDRAFDDLVVVQGDDPARIATFLDPGRRMAVHRLVAEYPGVEIGDDGIEWSTQGRERDADRLVTTVRRFASVAGMLSRPTRRSTSEALRAQAEGDAGRAVELLEGDPWEDDPWDEGPGPGLPDPEERFIVGQAAYAGGRYEEAARALRDVEAALPGDEQAAMWRRRAEERLAPAGPAQPTADVGAGPSAADIADELFVPGMLTFETARRFEEDFEGRRVRWSGTLVRWRAFRSDLDFGRDPGTKAVIRVHRLGWDLYGGRDVDAVLRLPEDAEERLTGLRDEEVAFEGTLLRVDPLMRNIYLADAVLI